MNRAELAGKVALKTDLNRGNAIQVVDAMVASIREALQSGDVVRIAGFGTFKTVDRAPRTARNPRTGETVHVPARKAVKFKVSKQLNESLA